MTGLNPVGAAPVADISIPFSSANGALTATASTSYTEPAVWLAKITTDATTVAVSDRGWRQEPGDTVASGIVWYPPRMLAPPTIIRRISVYPGGARRLAAEAGELVLANGDGGLDSLAGDWAIAGRSVTLHRAPHRRPIHAARSTWVSVTELRTAGAFVGNETLRVSLKTAAADLSGAACDTYAGTGGDEGDSGLTGQYKPRVYGYVRNMVPTLVSAANLIYQVNDGAISDVIAVRDAGVPLTLAASTSSTYNDLVSEAVAAGYYKFVTQTGHIKLGSTPTALTADVRGAAPGALGGYSATAGATAALIINQLYYNSLYANGASFDWPNAEAGIVVRGGTVADALDALTAGLGACWWGHDNRGPTGNIRWRGGRLRPPETMATGVTIQPHMLLEPPQEAPGAQPPWWRVRVGYQRLEAVQTGSDIAGSVTAANRDYYGRQQRVAEASDTDVQTDYPMAVDGGEIAGVLESSGEAQAVADELLALYSLPRRMWAVKVGASSRLRWWDLDVGSAVILQWPNISELSTGRSRVSDLGGGAVGRRFVSTGTDGRTLIVVGISAVGDVAELMLWG